MKKFARNASFWVYNTVLSYVQNKEDAEEIVQDTLIAALKSLKEFRSDSALKTWVYRIALNKSKDFLKYKKRKKRAGRVVSIFDREEEGLNFEPTNFIHPGIEMESKEHMELLFNAINQLPENQKTALILAKLDHKTQKEIAVVMDISTKAVESLISRAKMNLKKYLEQKDLIILKKKKN